MAGYSGTPLAKKLGIKEGFKVFAASAPEGYLALLEPLPPAVQLLPELDRSTDLVHHFTTRRAELSEALAGYRAALAPDATIWVSWPKKAAAKSDRIPTDVTEDTIREVALPLGFVDVKVCAVDDVWSGLKLVVRKELR
jgi:hypothetical protein